MPIEEQVAAHYGRGGLSTAILSALTKSGKDVDRLATTDLAGADEFHFGWRPATLWFAETLNFPADSQVLDIGAGLGGPARLFAEEHRVNVTGVDLTDEYVDVATDLTRRCGLSERATFQQANALDLPFPDASFDGAYTIHVAMNIRDKQQLFAEVRRILKPGSRFGIYDIMWIADQDIPYPMPWADTDATSFVEAPEQYRSWLTAAGFTIESEDDLSDLTREVGRKMSERAAADGPPPLSLHTVMGPATPQRLGNAMSALSRGIIAPIGMIAAAS